MKSNKYWEKRAAKTMYEQMADVEKTADVMSKAFHRAAVELEKEMKHIFSTFQGELTEKQARDLLEKADSIDFGNLMDSYNKLPDSPAKEAILKQINSPAYKARIARLEQLAKDVEKKSRELYGVQTRRISSVLKDTVSESYYRSVFDIQKNIGFSYEFARMNERNIDVILSRPWSGKHYSERIWGNTEKLTNVLKEELLVGFMTGKSYREMADVVMEEMASGAMDARRLVRTEANFVANQGHKEAYEDAEIEKYQFVGTLDNKTSPMCQELDGKIFPLEKAKVGVNYPPIHPWCRSTTVASFDDEDDEIVKKLRKRRARDPETGKTYLVPADTTYEQWRNGLEGEGKWLSYNPHSKAEREQYERYKSVLREYAPKNLEEFIKVKYNKEGEWSNLQYAYRTVNRYEVDGDVPVEKILQLDNVAYYTKKKGFDYSAFSGKEKKRVKNSISNGGNAATMEFDGKIYFSHSSFGLKGTFEHSLYIGDYPTVSLSNDRVFKEKYLDDGVPRIYDTEAKFLEFVAKQKNPAEKFSVTILSEKHICESCQGIVKQFCEKFPQATINIVSGKRGYNNDEKGRKTWKHRKKVK